MDFLFIRIPLLLTLFLKISDFYESLKKKLLKKEEKIVKIFTALRADRL